jgi:hypothetical protein
VATNNRAGVEEANLLYSRFVAPLEAAHRGEYAAVSTDGKVIFGHTLLDVVDQAVAELGPGNFVFKVGDRAIGKWLILTEE